MWYMVSLAQRDIKRVFTDEKEAYFVAAFMAAMYGNLTTESFNQDNWNTTLFN